MSKISRMGHRLYTGEVSYDFIGRRRLWYTISAVMLTISVLAVVVRGLTWGIEFSGGADFRAPTTVTSTSVQDMREALDASGVPELDEARSTPSATIRSGSRHGRLIPPPKYRRCARPSPTRSESRPIRWPTASSVRPGAGRSPSGR